MFSKKEIKGIKNKANKKEYNNYSFMTTERPHDKKIKQKNKLTT
jgi:hypothetical protein